MLHARLQTLPAAALPGCTQARGQTGQATADNARMHPPAAEAEPAPTDWAFTVSVRSLCEFTAKQGDLDRRFTPSATALEGLRGQALVAQRRGPDYEAEVALEGRHGGLRVRGRADGYDPARRCLEEVKTIRGQPEDLPENRRLLHWAQLLTYGALFCQERGVPELLLALVYFDVETQRETVLQELFAAETLEAAWRARCEAFVGWARQEARHREARDGFLRALGFPQAGFRPGQRALAEAVYRSAISGRSLLAEAPTGIGKTVGTLFPALRALPERGLDKLAYVTCKGSARLQALHTLAGLGGLPAQRPLRVVVAVAKDQACEHPDKACHGESCPLARGFYDRLPAARAEAVAEGWLDAASQRRVALRHGVCPYYLGQELLRWGDVLVGDAHHLFDPNGQIAGLQQALDWRLLVLVDEAHNLVERTRAMYSAAIDLDRVEAQRRACPAEVRPALDRWVDAATAWARGQDDAISFHEALPTEVEDTLAFTARALAEHLQRHPLVVGPLLELHFELQRFVRLLDTLGDASLLVVERGAAEADPGLAPEPAEPQPPPRQPGGLRLSIRCVVPARHLRPRWKAWQGSVLFSATLSPPDYLLQMLGLPEDSVWHQVPPVFAADHLQVRVARGLSTRFADRGRTLDRLTGILARQHDELPGNYLAFFSSFDYLDRVADRLQGLRPDIPQWRQERRMTPAARDAFLARFQPDGQGIGFAVLGGLFSEGVDLPGTRLIGAFIATLGLPPVSPWQSAVQARMEGLFGSDQAYADLVPALHKVVQAAGRILRAPEDRGWLWLLDERYAHPKVVSLLPAVWGLSGSRASDETAEGRDSPST